MNQQSASWLVVLLCGVLAGGCGEAVPEPRASASASTGSTGKQWFTEITEQVGIDFKHESGVTGEFHLPEIMGAGAALFDIDGDGDLDIYLTNGNRTLQAMGTAETLHNRLYRQEPDGTFVDVTAQSGLGDGGYGMGAAIGDIDNDGDLDVYVCNFGIDQLYRNEGNGTFRNVTAAAGVDVDGWSTSAAFFDFDLDGHLDIYIARYVEYDPDSPCFDTAGRPDYCSPLVFTPARDVLLHNDGDGTFSDISGPAGIGATAAAGLGVVCDDFNDDGWPDVYVANDAYANNLWINQGGGVFRDDGLLLGAAYNLQGEEEAGMGVTAGDFDNDGDPDLFMTHLGRESNTLLRNLGGSRGFTDVTGQCGLGPSSMPFTGFGTAALDVELDGDLDLIVANGRVFRRDPVAGTLLPPPWDVYAEPNLFYLNDGSSVFTLLRAPVASLCQPLEVSRGLAVGDIDADGDLDVLLSNVHGPARLYRNDAPREGHWLTVRAVDPRLGRDAIGARICVTAGGRRLYRTIAGALGYISSSQLEAHFGLGDAADVSKIEVRWPDGRRETFGGGRADRAIVLVRGEGEAAR